VTINHTSDTLVTLLLLNDHDTRVCGLRILLLQALCFKNAPEYTILRRKTQNKLPFGAPSLVLYANYENETMHRITPPQQKPWLRPCTRDHRFTLD